MDPLTPRGVRLTFGSGAVAPDGAKGFAVGIEYAQVNEPYGDLVSWHHQLSTAADDFEARVEMFLPAGRRAWTAGDAPLPPVPVVEWCMACNLPITVARVDVHPVSVVEDPFGVERTELWPVGIETERILLWDGHDRVVRRYRYLMVEHPFPAVC